VTRAHAPRQTNGVDAGMMAQAAAQVQQQCPGSPGSADSTTVLVKNVSHEVDDKALADAFKSIGPVQATVILLGVPDSSSPTTQDYQTADKTRRYQNCNHNRMGYVSFSCKEHAEAAVQSMQGKVLAGRVMRVEVAKSCPTVRPAQGRLSALSVFHRKSIFYGAFVWARRPFNRPKLRFPARAAGGILGGRAAACDGAKPGGGAIRDSQHSLACCADLCGGCF
jgi:hypothetical protein